jgi:ribonuclease HII
MTQTILRRFYLENTLVDNRYEICIDEAGRGCMFGRVYIACVILPKEHDLFSGIGIKDSKKFTSKKKMNEVAEYIRTRAFAWHIAFVDEKRIDEINILKSVMSGMCECIRSVVANIQKTRSSNYNITDFTAIIDGNYFTGYREYQEGSESMIEMPHVTVEKGDSIYMGIAAASILAKTARDTYVLNMCSQYPELSSKYCLHKNMGYGTKEHMEAIKRHGITQWHRRSFGICRDAPVSEIESEIS